MAKKTAKTSNKKSANKKSVNKKSAMAEVVEDAAQVSEVSTDTVTEDESGALEIRRRMPSVAGYSQRVLNEWLKSPEATETSTKAKLLEAIELGAARSSIIRIHSTFNALRGRRERNDLQEGRSIDV